MITNKKYNGFLRVIPGVELILERQPTRQRGHPDISEVKADREPGGKMKLEHFTEQDQVHGDIPTFLYPSFLPLYSHTPPVNSLTPSLSSIRWTRWGGQVAEWVSFVHGPKGVATGVYCSFILPLPFLLSLPLSPFIIPLYYSLSFLRHSEFRPFFPSLIFCSEV